MFSPSRDGAHDQELVELQLHDNEIVVVKVWRPVCFLLCMHLIFAHQRKQHAHHTLQLVSMKVSNPNLQQLDSKTLHILHHNTASNALKAAQNDTYTHGVLKSLVVAFQGNRFTVVFICAALSNCGAPVPLTSSFIDAQSVQRFKRALQERNQVLNCGALIPAFASRHASVCL